MKQILIAIIFLISLTLTQQRPLNHKKIKYAINCGSNRSKRATGGFVYSEDTFFDNSYSQSKVIDYRQLEDFNNEFLFYTDDREIYMTQRYSENGNIVYNIPTKDLDKNRKYVLILQFMEFEYSKPGKRKFNINLGNSTVFKEYDIASKNQNRGGKFVVQDEYIEFLLQDNGMIKFHQIYKDYFSELNEDGSIPLILEKIENYPVINGIILFDGNIFDTNKAEIEGDNRYWLEQHKNEWNDHKNRKQEEKRKYLEEEKQKKIRFKNEQEELKQDQQFSIDQMIQTPLGILMVIIIFISTFTMIYFTFFDPYGMEMQEKQKEIELKKKEQQKNKKYYQKIEFDDQDEQNLTQRNKDSKIE
ncbi:hypothetical protein PPERSA_09520 [Pseudocohnilembus persalinus]|uniref:Malectin domain-containing protein n=1 Tax=Pseudocohnilembus persalinus TaxID=266149 RepID=A0A0V0QFD0_PSEPJ|nr:hypothetical protein PPERSA_09520 [Pseudocohnilembus persalinus]|eukprot:KRX00914.1 hypothetical protein PPERSA_09520 [Pseudocohnilembus persalinus]